MKITAITRYKHGGLYAALKSLKWTQTEFAIKCSLSQATIGNIINLRYKPSVNLVQKMQNALAEAGYYLDVLEQWPETFHGLEAGFSLVQTADIELENLLESKEAFMIQAPECEDTEQIDKELDDALCDLDSRQNACIRMRFFEGKNLKEAGVELGVTRERARQIQVQALRRLRGRFKVDNDKIGPKRFPSLLEKIEMQGMLK